MNNSRFKLYLIITLVFSGLLPIAGSTFLRLFLIDMYRIDEPLHSVFEALGSFIALSLAILILLLQKDKRIPHYYTWVSCALIGMGLLDAFHAFSPPGDSFVLLHSMAILVGGFLLAMVWLPDYITQSRLASTLSTIVAVVAIIFGVSASTFPDSLPSMINGGVFTTAADAVNIVSGLFFLLAAMYFVIRYRSDHNIEDFLFANFCLLNSWVGLLFPLSQLWNAEWWFWHLLRLIAYFTVISYMFITFQRSEAELKQHREHLEELIQKRTVELKKTNEQLQQEVDERRHVEEKLSRAHDELEIHVTERTSQLAKANEALLESEASYRELAESIGEVFYAMNRDLRYTYWNSASETLTGICAKDAVGKSLTELFPELKKTRAEKLYIEVLKTQQPQRFVHRYRAGDKDLFFEINAYPSKSGLSVIAKDITERKHAEENISKLLDELKTIFENLPLGIAYLDAEFKLLNANKFFYDLTGLSEEELIGRPCYETVGEYADSTKKGLEKICSFCKKDECSNTRRPTVIERPLGSSIVKVTTVPQLDKYGEIFRFLEIIEDITERKLSEAALLESEERYRKLVESSPDTIAIHSQGKIVFTNSAGAKLLGAANPEQLIGKKIMDFVHPDYREFVRKRIQQMNEERQDVPIVEEKFVRLDGSVIDVEIAATPFMHQGKNGMQVIIRDITERKQIEEILHERERSYRTLSENLPGIVYRVLLRENNRMMFFNNTVQPMTGFTEEELMAGDVCSLDTLILSEDRALVTTTVKRAIMHNQPFEVEYRLKHKKGDIRYFLERGRPINGADGEPLYIDGVIFDVTENKQAEEHIREQAELLDKAQDAISLWDLEHRLIYWNKGAQCLYGWTREEVTGKNADELLYKEKTLQLVEAKKCVIEKGEWIGELHHATKDRKEIIVESRWTLVHNNKGEPKSILVINTDITEKKKLEAQFLRAQRLESVGTLASGIAHDINNVLTPMMLSLQLLQEKFTDNESRNLLNILERSTQRGASLVKQVQSFAKGVEGERVALQVSHLISEITQIARETFPKSIEVRTDIQKNLWTISGDATQLHQVIMNLCVNARDAMPEGGILNTSAENIFIDENYARMNIDARVGQYVVITVSDTGTGIPPGILDRIFEPFFTTKQPGKGTGLGLSTVLSIVKSHGGFINIYSEVGKGTVFKVYLPVVMKDKAQKVDEQLELLAGHGESILVVDDEAMVRDITSSILETHGYRVLTANDGSDAIKVYMQNREQIKVILMDMMMPVMDGQACIRALHEVNPDTRIIAVSGLAEKGKLEKVAATQVKAFLLKPYVAGRLLKTIHEVISSK